MRLFAVILALATFLIASCDIDRSEAEDPVLATVHNYRLRLSKAEKYIAPGSTPKDSLSQLRSYVEQWVRDMVLLHEAERNLPASIDIDDLVRDYRNSLIISNFEKNSVEAKLDTLITNAELQEYYQRNKDQYQLEQTIVRGRFVKLPSALDSIQIFRDWWDSDDEEDFIEVVDFASRKADVFLLEDSTWYRVDEIERLMPPGTLRSRNMRPNTSLRFSDDDYEYYLRIAESVSSLEIAPLSYIREQAVRFIMHKRKLELLEQMKRTLYEEEMENGHIKVYLK